MPNISTHPYAPTSAQAMFAQPACRRLTGEFQVDFVSPMYQIGGMSCQFCRKSRLKSPIQVGLTCPRKVRRGMKFASLRCADDCFRDKTKQETMNFKGRRPEQPQHKRQRRLFIAYCINSRLVSLLKTSRPPQPQFFIPLHPRFHASIDESTKKTK